MNLRTMFALRRTSDVLSKVRDAATALAFAGGRLTPLSAIGILTHVAAFVVGVSSRDLTSIATKWPQVRVPAELFGVLHSALDVAALHRSDNWSHCEILGHTVLMNAERCLLHVDGDEGAQQAVLGWARESLWRGLGQSVLLVPVGRWGDATTLRPSPERPAIDSARAREVWARVAPVLAAGHMRAVLLDGPPRTGKSTVARQLVQNLGGLLGRSPRVLRIAVSDFSYLQPSVVTSAVEMLRPDVLVLDDIDRFASSSQLLDMFEAVRPHLRLLVATSNNPKALPVALRLPGRIDEVLLVGGAGAELAASVLGTMWDQLEESQRVVVAGWPVALIEDLRLRLIHLQGAQADVEVAELQRRAAEALGAAAEGKS